MKFSQYFTEKQISLRKGTDKLNKYRTIISLYYLGTRKGYIVMPYDDIGTGTYAERRHKSQTCANDEHNLYQYSD